MKLLLENWREYLTEDWQDTSWEDDNEKIMIGDVNDYLADIEEKTVDINVLELSRQIPRLFSDEYLQDPDNRKRIETADLDHPIIILKSGGKYKSILDGNHRLQRAIEDKDVETIKAKILDLDNPEIPEVFKRMFGGQDETPT
jgi:hypothetical protein